MKQASEDKDEIIEVLPDDDENDGPVPGGDIIDIPRWNITLYS